MTIKYATCALTKVVYFAPYLLGCAIGAVVVATFWPDWAFLTLALSTIFVISIIVQWSWSAYLDETQAYRGEE